MAVSHVFSGHSLNIQQPLHKSSFGQLQAQMQKSLNISGPQITRKFSMAVSHLFSCHSLNIQQSRHKYS